MTRKIWVISDTHFNHANILKFKQDCGKPVRKFDNVKEMNDCIIDNWNSVVSDGDIVYHLGDVFFHQTEPEAIEDVLKRLKGRRRLVVGNHDRLKNPIYARFFQKIMMWRQFPEYSCILTHVPVHESTLYESRFKNHGEPVINVHGHVHTNTLPDSRYFNACVEAIDYTPINIEEIGNG